MAVAMSVTGANLMQLSQLWRVSILVVLPILAVFNMGAEGGCANSENAEDVAQDRITAQHWLYYSAKSDKTDVRAAYRFGNELGTVLQLNPPAKVSFGTTPLGFDPNWGWHHAEVSGVANNGALIYVDKDGLESRLQTGVIGPIAFAAGPLSFSRTESASLTWQGTPLATGEDVELFVASAANRLNFVRFTANAPGATAVVVTPDRLAQLPPGGAVFTLKRHKNTRPDEKTKLTLSYESLEVAGELR